MLKRYLPKRVPSYSDTATRGDCWCLAPSPVNEDLYTRKKKKFDTLKHTTKIKSKVKFSDQKTNCFQQSMLAVAAIIDSIIESTLVPHDMRWLQTLFVRASLTATKQNHDNPLIFYSPSWEKKQKKKSHKHKRNHISPAGHRRPLSQSAAVINQVNHTVNCSVDTLDASSSSSSLCLQTTRLVTYIT